MIPSKQGIYAVAQEISSFHSISKLHQTYILFRKPDLEYFPEEIQGWQDENGISSLLCSHNNQEYS